MSEVSSLLKNARRRAGITQTQLALRLGVSQAAVAKLERSDANPTIATLTEVLRMTGHRLTLGLEPVSGGVDESLIRQQLELSPAERLRGIEQMYVQGRMLRLAGARSRGERASERWLASPELRLGALLGKLTAGGVDFVVIGGVAVILQSTPRFTKDLNICYAPDRDNLDRLGNVLIELGAKLRMVEEDVPFVPDERTLRQAQILTLVTGDGQIDLLAAPDGAPAYPELYARAIEIDIEGTAVRIASIDDLLAMKRAAKRPQDMVDIESLEIARRRGRSHT